MTASLPPPVASEPAVGRVVAVRSGLVFATMTALAVAVILAARASEPADPRNHVQVRTPRHTLPADRCEIAGSGSNIPLVRAIVAAFRQRHPEAQVIVDDSVGSSGGVRAVLDGVVHLGVISRPLKGSERRLGIQAVPHVAVPVVLGAHPDVVDDSLSSDALASLIRGGDARWSDGTHAVLLEREEGDSSYRILYAKNPKFRDAQEARKGRATHWRVLLHDTEMTAALAHTPGGVGLADLGVIRLTPVGPRVVRIDGLDPAAPDYPYLKELSFVVRGTPTGVTAQLLEFALGPEARALAVAAGYRPRF